VTTADMMLNTNLPPSLLGTQQPCCEAATAPRGTAPAEQGHCPPDPRVREHLDDSSSAFELLQQLPGRTSPA
jgi:hypothetical protein